MLKPTKKIENEQATATANAKAESAAKIEAGATASAPDVNNERLGIMSDKVEFVAPLGDPSHPDTTKDANGTAVVTSYIVGYRFKALADMVVPECGLGDDARKNLMSFRDKNGKKQVKAGETFDLTRFETGLLLAPEEFNGRINGGGKSYYATFQVNGLKSKTGQVATTGAATEVPTVALKSDGPGSIKDQQIIDVLTSTSTKGENGVVKKTRVIKPGFEKWEPLCVVQVARTSSGSTAAPKNMRNQKAVAFLEIVSKK